MEQGTIVRRMIASLALAGLVVALPAAAQQRTWRRASGADDQQAVIDTASITRDGDRVRFWREIRMGSARQFEGGERYDRIGALIEADCRARTFRSLELYAKMGERTLISGAARGEVEPVRPGSTAETDFKAVCFNDWPR